jgi:hypothetical protein
MCEKDPVTLDTTLLLARADWKHVQRKKYCVHGIMPVKT